MNAARVLGAALVCLLAGCGGGGGDAPPPATTTTTESAQGLWIGTTNTDRAITGLVFSDGTYYVLYSPIADPTLIAGVVQGTGAVSGSTFSSSDARDFSLERSNVLACSVSASIATKQTFNGSLACGAAGTTSFTSTYNTAFEQAPSLAALAGTFTGQVASSAGIQNATVTISATGAISGNAQGCIVSGSVTPRTDGNAFNQTITFGPAPCLFAGQTFTGIAFFDTPTKRLFAAAPNASRTNGVLFVGAKP
jgi:hypothetical protein